MNLKCNWNENGMKVKIHQKLPNADMIERKQHQLWVGWMRSDAVGPCCFVAGCCRCWMVHVFNRRLKFCKREAARRVRIWLVQLRTFNGTKHVIERVQVFYFFFCCDAMLMWSGRLWCEDLVNAERKAVLRHKVFIAAIVRHLFWPFPRYFQHCWRLPKL